jgi:hypothetical protein
MAYQRTWNPEWKVGMEVEFQGEHHKETGEGIKVLIKSISPKLGHATCEVPNYRGELITRKFDLGHQDYANEITEHRGFSRYRASIVIPSPERTARRERAIKLADAKSRQSAALQKLVDITKYYVLNDMQIERLEAMVVDVETAKKLHET